MKFAIYALTFFCTIVAFFVAIICIMYPVKYKTEITSAANSLGVDKKLIASVINTESGYNPNAISNKGAIGLMQLMPSTADYVAQKLDKTSYDLKDPQTNIQLGTWYLKYLLDKFGDTKTALIAYNAGEGNVINWLNEYKTQTLDNCPFPATNAYVEKVLHGMRYYKHRL